MTDRPPIRGGWPVKLGDVLKPTIERVGGKHVWTEARLRKVWKDTVGEQVAAHATVRRLRGSALEVTVTSDVWATELTYLASAVIEQLNAQLGAGTVTEIVVQKARRNRT